MPGSGWPVVMTARVTVLHRSAVAAHGDHLYCSLAWVTCSMPQRCMTRIICTSLPRLATAASSPCTALSSLALASRVRLPRSWPGGCWICGRACACWIWLAGTGSWPTAWLPAAAGSLALTPRLSSWTGPAPTRPPLGSASNTWPGTCARYRGRAALTGLSTGPPRLGTSTTPPIAPSWMGSPTPCGRVAGWRWTWTT